MENTAPSHTTPEAPNTRVADDMDVYQTCHPASVEEHTTGNQRHQSEDAYLNEARQNTKTTIDLDGSLLQRLDAMDVRIAELTSENSKLASENSKLNDRLDSCDRTFEAVLALAETVCKTSLTDVESFRSDLGVIRVELAVYEAVASVHGRQLAAVRTVLSNVNSVLMSIHGHALGLPVDLRDLDPLMKCNGGPTNTPEESGP